MLERGIRGLLYVPLQPMAENHGAVRAVRGCSIYVSVEDVELAVDAARKALFRNKGKDWASASGAVCAKYLRAIVAKITERKPELAKLETVDCGKPLDEATWDMDDVAACFEYYADLAEGLDAKLKTPISLHMESFKTYVLKEPIGVVGLIIPWYLLLLWSTFYAFLFIFYVNKELLDLLTW